MRTALTVSTRRVPMARCSLYSPIEMPTKRPLTWRCSYVVLVQGAGDSLHGLRELAAYLSTLGVAGCEVVILDSSPRLQFELNGRVLRWVGRHIAVSGGGLDIVRAAADYASCEKVIVADDDVRYTV